MKNLDFGGYAFSIGLAAALLAGCGGSQPVIGAIPSGAGRLAPSGSGYQTIFQFSGGTGGGAPASWVLPEAKSDDLLYVSDEQGVHIFSYPKGQEVGDLGVGGYGLCSNRAGDVFITDETVGHVYEFAHGATQPLKTLYDNTIDFNPVDCSVDPTTQNVAVSAADSPYVVIFPDAEQQPQVYAVAMQHTDMYSCAYDSHGDLFVDQLYDDKGNQYIAELPKASSVKMEWYQLT